MGNWITVHCPIYFRDFKVYGYIAKDENGEYIVPNGCDQCNNSSTCQKCMKDSIKPLTEKLLSQLP